jgi:NAD(P)-dependent dehydrogenase (short-subunit alcohol dehydrogenase family)
MNAKALVMGVGPEDGLGAGLCRRFASEDRVVIVAGRTATNVARVANQINASGGRAVPITADVTVEADVIRLFDEAMSEDPESGPADLVVYNAGNNQRIDFRETAGSEFEAFWRVNCFGGFLVGREAARRLAPLGRGTVLFSGATGSLRGSPGFAHFAASKAGLRMVAQSMAREFGPMGLHIAHVIIDGGINGERVRTRFSETAKTKGADGLLNIEAIAEAFWFLYRQHRTAWSHEIDLRPFKEGF